MKLFSTKRFGVKLLVVFVCFLCISTAFGAASDVDLTFGAHPSKDINYTGGISNGSMIVQPDGKVLIWGGFRVVNGIAVNRLIRLNTDGSIDGSFNCSECNKFFMSNALLQPDGKIIVAGSMLVGLSFKSKTIRINSDGSLDNSFSLQFSETGQGTNYGTVLFQSSVGR
jgi:Domain of unknown function (DUF5122) beta-propeller